MIWFHNNRTLQVHTFRPPQSVLNLETTELIGFLKQRHSSSNQEKVAELLVSFQQHQSICPNLQMICPRYGIPPPSFDLNIDSYNITLEFSVQLSNELIQYTESRDMEKSN